MTQPFLSFYTPTLGPRRPKGLMACMESVCAQTAFCEIEHLVLPDYVGLGIAGGLYGRMPQYLDAFHGEYAHTLADDDVLASPTVVEEVKAFARANDNPPVIIVTVRKAHLTLPSADLNPPKCGHIDMGCVIQRHDIFRQFVQAYQTGRYEADYDHAYALWQAGIPFAVMPLLFVIGGASRGAAEVAA